MLPIYYLFVPYFSKLLLLTPSSLSQKICIFAELELIAEDMLYPIGIQSFSEIRQNGDVSDLNNLKDISMRWQ